MVKCEYCSAEFTRVSSLRTHKNTARYCLKLQGRDCVKTAYSCDTCGREYMRSDKYEKHIQNCKSSTEPGMNALYAENKRLANQINQLQTQIIMMMGNTGGVNNRNVVMNNLQPLTDEDLQDHLGHLTLNFIQEGAKGYADFAGNYPFKDRLMCTDKSRKKLKYKDLDGEVVEDLGGVKLSQRFFQAIAPRNEEIINAEYDLLQKKVQQIAKEGTAYRTDLTGLLTKATHLQDILLKCQQAARGEENELTKEFITHLTRML